MVKRSESVFEPSLTSEQAQSADRLGPKGMGADCVALTLRSVDSRLPGGQQAPKTTSLLLRNVEAPYPAVDASRRQANRKDG